MEERLRIHFEERLRQIEVAVLHMDLMLNLHKKSLDNDEVVYSDSFKHGQQMIFDDVFPSMEEAKTEINNFKKELRSLSWKEKRKQLLEICGDVPDVK